MSDRAYGLLLDAKLPRALLVQVMLNAASHGHNVNGSAPAVLAATTVLPYHTVLYCTAESANCIRYRAEAAFCAGQQVA